MFIGYLMESFASVVVLAPTLSPIGTALGISEIHVGVIFCITLSILILFPQLVTFLPGFVS